MHFQVTYLCSSTLQPGPDAHRALTHTHCHVCLRRAMRCVVAAVSTPGTSSGAAPQPAQERSA